MILTSIISAMYDRYIHMRKMRKHIYMSKVALIINVSTTESQHAKTVIVHRILTAEGRKGVKILHRSKIEIIDSRVYTLKPEYDLQNPCNDIYNFIQSLREC
jgi:hypothetical protein